MDWETIHRVEALERLKTRLEKKDGDPCKELKNVVGIIAAYNNRFLKYDGLITYWCDGKSLQDPAKFDMADVQKLNTEKNRAGGGFWAEGVSFREREILRAILEHRALTRTHLISWISPAVYPKK